MTESGLSQWVVCAGTPYAVEIYQTDLHPGWRVDVVDALARTTVWTGAADDDAMALVQALQTIHARAKVMPAEPANTRAGPFPVRRQALGAAGDPAGSGPKTASMRPKRAKTG